MAEPGKYDDILHLPHHVSPTRPRMSMAERAAQFSPFAALSGHDEAIRETGRVTEGKIQLGEDERAALDRKQRLILAALEQGKRPPVTVTYFQPDPRKEGGEYLTVTGAVKRVDAAGGYLCLTDGKKLPFDAILEIELSQ